MWISKSGCCYWCQDRGLGRRLSPAKSHSRVRVTGDSGNTGESHLAKMVREVTSRVITGKKSDGGICPIAMGKVFDNACRYLPSYLHCSSQFSWHFLGADPVLCASVITRCWWTSSSSLRTDFNTEAPGSTRRVIRLLPFFVCTLGLSFSMF